MINKLIEPFKKYDFIANEQKDRFSYNIDTKYFGCIYGNFDFSESTFTVNCEMDEDAYTNLFPDTYEEEIDEDELSEWNTQDEYSDIINALNTIINTLSAINSESDGSLDDEYLSFITDIKAIIKTL